MLRISPSNLVASASPAVRCPSRNSRTFSAQLFGGQSHWNMKPSQPADRHDRDIVHLRLNLQGPPQHVLDGIEQTAALERLGDKWDQVLSRPGVLQQLVKDA